VNAEEEERAYDRLAVICVRADERADEKELAEARARRKKGEHGELHADQAAKRSAGSEP